MRKQRNAAFTDEIITEQKEVSADNNNAKTDGTSGLKMKRKNSYFSGYGTENLGSCPAPFTCGGRMSAEQPRKTSGFLCGIGVGCGGLLQDQGRRMRREK